MILLSTWRNICVISCPPRVIGMNKYFYFFINKMATFDNDETETATSIIQ